MSNAIPGTGSTNLNDTTSLKAGAIPSQLLASLRSNSLLPLLIAGAAAIAAVAALLLWAKAPDYRVLYSNFSEADGGRIISELDKRGVPYRLSDGGSALLVPSEQMHSLRLQLAEQGLPQAGNVGFELLDKQAFGVSQFAEHINFQRGLEGELARSIESLGPVSKARVHLAMPKQSIFVRDRQPASASVVLTLHAGRALGEGQVNAIVHMVSSSVPELAAEAVTVVNQSGRLLTASTSNGRDLDGTQLDYIYEIETTYQRRIERILTPILGAENVRAQVAVEIDFAAREQTAERFTPNQPPNEAAIRSQQLSENYSGSSELARGIPGALSNTPPSSPTPPAPVATQGQNKTGQGAETSANAAVTTTSAQEPTGSLRRDNLINYEVDRSVEHVQQRGATIKRLTAAVVLNYRTASDANGNATREALSEEELSTINRLVKQAMGFSNARGDELEVVNSPFAEAREIVSESPWWQTPEFFVMATTLARYLITAIAALLLWLLLLRPLMKRHFAPALAVGSSEGTGAAGTATSEGGSAAAEETAATAENGGLDRRLRRRSAVYEHNLASLREMAKEDPRLIAMIVSGWMKKND